MKKILLYGMVMLVAFLGSCQQEAIESGNPVLKGDGFYMNLSVSDVATGVQTRSVVDPEAGETNVSELYLLFFEYTTDGTGEFIDAMKFDNPVMSTNIPVDFTAHPDLSSGAAYSILAFANVGITGDKYLDTDIYSNLTQFVNSFDGLTENEALAVSLLLTGPSNNNESDDTHAIKASEIVMSAQVTKEANASTISLTLDRGVARIDSKLSETLRADYDLASISIWNAAKTTNLWYDRADAPETMGRFYGLKNAAGTKIQKGGLYTFENFVSTPAAADKRTTCAIIGLNPLTSNAHGTVGTTMYYRINISRTGGSQNLKRNYVYDINISSVLDAGYNSEDEAYKSAENNLNYEINNWNVDSDGVIHTDGTHILGLPFRKVVLSPDGEIRRATVFTSGPANTAPVRISQKSTVSGLDAYLNGNELVITAIALGALDERRATVELEYGGLRGTIDIIQSASEDQYLELNKSQMLIAVAQGPAEVSGGRVVVTSSGPWTAKIYNNSVGGNPGFSFSTTDVVTELTQTGNNGSNEIAIYTTGTNPNNVDRYAFIIVTLDADDTINRSLPLRQRGISDIEITPGEYENSGIAFTRNGTPIGLPNAQPGNPFTITVAPGTDDDGNLNAWTAVLSGTDAGQFRVEQTSGVEEAVRVYANGENTSGAPYNAVLTISNGGSTKTIAVTQAGAPVEVTQAGSLGLVPKTGTTSIDNAVVFRVSLAGASAGTTYTAEIVSNSDADHPAFFINNAGQTSTTWAATDLSTLMGVGFDMVHFPKVDYTYTATVRVTVSGATPHDFVVSQEQLTRLPIQLLDGRSSHNYGSLGDDGNYFRTYYNCLVNSFGAGNPIKSSAATFTSTYSGGSISSGFNLLHAGSRKDTWNTSDFVALNNWRINSNGVIVYVQDREVHRGTHGMNNPLLSAVGVSARSQDKNQSISLGAAGNRVMQYITQDGPYGAVASFNWSSGPRTFTVNHSGVTVLAGADGGAYVMVDPANSFVFIGDCLIFNGTSGDNVKLMQNLQAFILMAAQYGKGFLDIFTDSSVDYPFNTPGFVYP